MGSFSGKKCASIVPSTCKVGCLYFYDICTKLVVFSPTHLKNMRKSNWINLPPIFEVKISKIFELPPPTSSVYHLSI